MLRVWVLLNVNLDEVTIGGVFRFKSEAMEAASRWSEYLKGAGPGTPYVWEDWSMDFRKLIHRETGRYAGKYQVLSHEVVNEA